MKQVKHIWILLILAGTFISCSDEFLDGNRKDFFVLEDTLFVDSNEDAGFISLDLGSMPVSDYTITLFPKFLSFDDMHGKTSSNTLIPFSIVKDYIPQSYQPFYSSIVFDVKNLGLISMTMEFDNLGNPMLQCSSNSLTFSFSVTQTFNISNIAPGILKWQISGIPEWLVLSQTSGSLVNGASITITATVNSAKIVSDQEYNATLQIISNSVTGNLDLPVKVYADTGFPSSIRNIEGIVVDAEASHQSGIYAILTRSPNSLIVFNTATDVSTTVPLSKTPSCISITEDGTKVLVGYSENSIAYIDVANLQVSNEFSIDCSPFDIVLGDNGWAYITPLDGQWVNFRSFDLNSGQMYIGSASSQIYEKTILRKIPGKPFLAGTRTSLSPTGLLIFDITNGKAGDLFNYYHEDIGNLWISADGTRLYCRTKKIYVMPEYDGEYHFTSPTLAGIIESQLYNISGLDECPAINSVFFFSSYFDYPAEQATAIEQYNRETLERIKSFHTTPVEVTENGTTHLYESNPRFIFANNQGTKLFSINNLKETLHKDYWTIQVFDIGSDSR